MELMNDFINRNKTTYQKTADVPQELIAKYKGIAHASASVSLVLTTQNP